METVIIIGLFLAVLVAVAFAADYRRRNKTSIENYDNFQKGRRAKEEKERELQKLSKAELIKRGSKWMRDNK